MRNPLLVFSSAKLSCKQMHKKDSSQFYRFVSCIESALPSASPQAIEKENVAIVLFASMLVDDCTFLFVWMLQNRKKAPIVRG